MNASGGSGMDEGDYGADGGAGILEARYRRIMALLPSAYRERRGEEMISTLLDGATEGRRWPRVGEAASLVALAMRLLVGAPGGTRRAVAAGQVLQRTALAGLLALGLWNATAGVANTVAVFSKVGHYYYRDLISSTWTWPFTMNLVQPLVYFGAFAALVRGRRRLGRILGVAQVGMVAAEVLQDANWVTSDRVALLTVAAVIALAAGLGFHRAVAPLLTPGRWLAVAAGLTGVVVIVAATLTAVAYNDTSVPDALAITAQLVAGPLVPALAAIFGVLRARRSPIWPAALFILGVPGLLIVPRAVIIYVQGKYENLFVGDLFVGSLWPGLPVYMLVTEIVLAAALGWSLYRSRRRSTSVPA